MVRGIIRYTYSADYCLLLYMQWQNIEVVYIKGKVLIENESENGIFQMYGLDGAGHAPSLYTKYYRVVIMQKCCIGGIGCRGEIEAIDGWEQTTFVL